MSPILDTPLAADERERLDELVATEGEDWNVFPLSFAQERLWFFEQWRPGTAAYALPLAARLRGPLSTPDLELALRALVVRHEILRTSFAEIGGRPVQVIEPEVDVELPVCDLRGLEPEARETEIARRGAGHARRPFDLTRGPLLRPLLFACDAEDHRLLLALHHVVADGWSMGILVRELGALYAAASGGEAPLLPELEIQYADYAAWQREWMVGETLEGLLAHWRERLADLEPLELPTDHRRGRSGSFDGARSSLDFGRSLKQGLTVLATENGTTLFVVLLAAFQALLGRYTGQTDIAVGSPIAGRNRGEIEGLIGFFVNTLVLRGDLRGNPTFRALLERVRETTIDAYSHQDLPFEKLVEDLEPERRIDRHPLFQVMLVLQNAPLPDLALGDLRFEVEDVDVEAAKFDLTLTFLEEGDSLRGSLSYSTELFEASTACRMVRHLESMLEEAVRDPDRPLGELSILGAGERHQLVAEWNDTATVAPPTALANAEVTRVNQWITKRARERPEAVALVSGERLMTYGELARSARRLADVLRRRGVGPESVVGVALERSFEMVSAILAVLEAGGAFLPLDSSYPGERLAFMAQDGGAELILTHDATEEKLESILPPLERGGVERLRVDLELDREDGESAGGEPAAEARESADGEQAAYVLYTSGSTGRPNGVVVSHRALLGHTRWLQRDFPLTPDDVALQKTPISFDAAVGEIFAPLVVGARLVLARPDGHRDPAYLGAEMARAGVTVLHLVPSLLRALLEDGGLAAVFTLRRVTCGGESLPPELARRAREELGLEVGNLYGPAEATIHATSTVVGDDPVTLGRPIDDTRVHLLDAGSSPAPIGVPGELWIAGLPLARGYAGRAALTADRFRPDPFSREPGARIYRSGDRGRLGHQGRIEFLGRRDHQVKIRGMRVEIGEIEALLAEHEAVADAAVVLRDAAGGPLLVAWVVPRSGDANPETLASETRDFLRRRLPAHMVPTFISLLDHLPLGPSGKVDRRALARETLSGESTKSERVAPRTPLEEGLVGIWAEILRAPRVGIHDSFFELGGHSLLAAQMVTRAREHLGRELELRWVFEEPTIAELARRLEEEARRNEGSSTVLPPVEKRADDLPAPLSFAQERLWFFSKLNPEAPLYTLPYAFRLRGDLDVAALRAAVAEVGRRHEVLRSRVIDRDEAPRQESVELSLEVPLVDFGALGEARAREETRRFLATPPPLAIERGPWVSFLLLRQDGGDHVLFVHLHHLAGDAWSLGILASELAAFYGAALTSPSAARSSLPEPRLQYADFAAWQRRLLDEGAFEGELAHWREQLRGAPPLLELPTDRPRPAVMSFRGAALPLALAPETVEGLRDLGQKHGASLYTTFMALFQALLRRYSGQRDVVVGSPLASRPGLEVEGLIGLFLNMVALRVRAPRDVSFSALLARTRNTVLSSYAAANIPFERVVEELTPRRSASHTPLFQVMLSFFADRGTCLELPGLESEALDLEVGAARFDLTVGLREISCEGDAPLVEGVIEYNSDLFDETTVRRLASHWATLARAAVATPELPATALALMSPAEEQQVVREWPDRRRALEPATLHGLVEARAALDPEAVALVFEDRELTHRELDRRASRLARRLVALGVEPEEVVGLHLERSLSMVVGLLAVLKAGGAYLPLDPGYPHERLALMAEDAGLRVLLTDPGSHLEIERADGEAVIRVEVDAEGTAEAGDPGLGEALPELPEVRAEHLAYVIYTSGSTGRPKGVMIDHHSATHFLLAMDEVVDPREPGIWLAVTSISFDISVLEIFWTLSRGARVVVQGEPPRGVARATGASAEATTALDRRGMEFSLFYFASAQSAAGENAYRLLLEGARQADRLGFSAVWTPERHFHDFGGLYPNPAVTGAALAAITESLQIRAGSVVLPLHHPVRVAEEWSVVDNISGGRVGVSFASGWHADDFIFFPDRYEDRKDVLMREIETVRQLWRGEKPTFRGGAGQEVEVAIYPKPVQEELPIWLTAAGNPETFRLAGEAGASLLTHLLGQTIDALEEKITVYRQAWRDAGHPGRGHVSLMLHTFVGEDLEAVREKVRQPFTSYLESATGLISNLIRSLGQEGRLEDYSAEERQALLDHAFERYFNASGLMGTVDSCRETLVGIAAAGVDEVACLIDFGVPNDEVLESLEHLGELRRVCTPRDARGSVGEDAAPGASVPEQLQRHQITHLQCTPSMARLLVADPAAAPGLAGLEKLFLGGEALPPDLLAELRRKTPAEIHNLYGPTEATVWAAAKMVAEKRPAPGGDSKSPVTLGREILNTRIHVLDPGLRSLPARAPGQLFIGGEGLARGYLGRPALTAERFVPDPRAGEGAPPGARLYATGDSARRSGAGELEFLGRLDHQLKFQGHRVEPGEIESALRSHEAVEEAVVVPYGMDAEGGGRLVAYVVPALSSASATGADLSAEERRRIVGDHATFTLPNGMTVTHFDSRQARGVYDEVFAERGYLRHGIDYADGDCIFDVGANVGFFSLFAGQMCRPEKIYAFEPIPATAALLRANLALHGLDAEIIEAGVSNQPGSADFIFYRHRAGLSGLAEGQETDLRELEALAHHGMAEFGAGGELGEGEVGETLAEYMRGETIERPLVRLSDVIAEHEVERIDLLKVDAERSEARVLRGLAEEDWPKIRQVVLEVHSRELLAECRAMLEPRGFTLEVDDLVDVPGQADGDEGLYACMVYARRPGESTSERRSKPRAATLELSWTELRSYLAERLPPYMMPGLFVTLTSLPLTPNGKIDRGALPPPEAADRGERTAYVAPKGELEGQVAAIWREVLKISEISRNESFFEAGGTSLLLVRVHQEIQKSFDREISLVDLFRHPTIADMAELLAHGRQTQAAAVEQSRERARRQAEALETSDALDRQRQFMSRRRRGASKPSFNQDFDN